MITIRVGKTPVIANKPPEAEPEAARSLNDMILLIDKGEDQTSFDVVRDVRRLTGIKKIGHCGTLDRFATGLLVMCTGRATRLATYLVNGEKTYRARIALGVETDTGDPEGRVVKTGPWDEISREHIVRALEPFRGEINQMPPLYSALKVGGARASDLVRKGRDVALKARKVVIHDLQVADYDRQPGLLDLDIRCSRGTYIRSLARDLGQVLGCGAHVTGLRRTASGSFFVDDAVTLEELRRYLESGHGRRNFLRKPLDAMKEYSRCVVTAAARIRAANGAFFPREDVMSLVNKEEKKFIILDEDENLIAIADIDTDKWHINYDCVVML